MARGGLGRGGRVCKCVWGRRGVWPHEVSARSTTIYGQREHSKEHFEHLL